MGKALRSSSRIQPCAPAENGRREPWVTDNDLLRVTNIARKYALNCMLLIIFRPSLAAITCSNLMKSSAFDMLTAIARQ
jgi:hypothetical protein